MNRSVVNIAKNQKLFTWEIAKYKTFGRNSLFKNSLILTASLFDFISVSIHCINIGISPLKKLRGLFI